MPPKTIFGYFISNCMDYFIASVYGLYKKKYELATYTGVVWLTSINYWKNPKSRFNYFIDVTAVRSGIIYHLIRAPDSSQYINFYTIFNTGLLCDIPYRYCLTQKNYILSTVSHAGLHLITGVRLIYLYSTKMTPLSKSYLLHYIQYYLLLDTIRLCVPPRDLTKAFCWGRRVFKSVRF